MTSWPWMKGIQVAIAEPIEPVNAADSRPAVKDVIAKHRDAIDKVRAAIENDVNFVATKHDDLWILRFILSHKKKLKAAIKAAQHCLSFRAEHKLDDTDIRFHPLGPKALSEGAKRYMSYCSDDAVVLGLPDPKRGVVAFLNFPGINQHALVEHVDPGDSLSLFVYVAEWTHQWLDYVTRTTGRLTKSVRLADVSHSTLAQLSYECHKRDGAAMEVTEDVYPQMLEKVFICHAPSWIQVPWRILRPLMPKRVVAKVDFINPDHKRNELERLLEYIDEEHIPVRFGGKYGTWPAVFPLPEQT